MSARSDVLRIYSYTRWRSLVFQAYVVFQSAAVVVLAVANKAEWWGWMWCGALISAFFYAVFVWWPGRRVYETEEGLHDMSFPSGRLIRWDGIERFVFVRTLLGPRVAVLMVKGPPQSVNGFAPQDTVSWQDGSTDDIVDELNQRLRYWQARDQSEIDGAKAR